MSGVGSSVLSATILLLPLKLNIFFMKYLATGSREDGAQALKLQFECIPYHGVSSLSHVQERRAWKMRGDLKAINWFKINSM